MLHNVRVCYLKCMYTVLTQCYEMSHDSNSQDWGGGSRRSSVSLGSPWSFAELVSPTGGRREGYAGRRRSKGADQMQSTPQGSFGRVGWDEWPWALRWWTEGLQSPLPVRVRGQTGGKDTMRAMLRARQRRMLPGSQSWRCDEGLPAVTQWRQCNSQPPGPGWWQGDRGEWKTMRQ